MAASCPRASAGRPAAEGSNRCKPVLQRALAKAKGRSRIAEPPRCPVYGKRFRIRLSPPQVICRKRQSFEAAKRNVVALVSR